MFLIEPRDEKICFCKLENKGSAQLVRKCMFIYFATDSTSQNFTTPKVKASSHNLLLNSPNLCLLLFGSPNTGFLKALLTFHSDFRIVSVDVLEFIFIQIKQNIPYQIRKKYYKAHFGIWVLFEYRILLNCESILSRIKTVQYVVERV